MVTPIFNPASPFLGLMGKRREALFAIQPSGGDYPTGPDTDVNPNTGVTVAYVRGVILVDPSTGLAYKATGGGGAGAPYVGTPLGYQQIVGLATATALTVPNGATYAVIQPDSQAVRWRDDATNPTTTVGFPLGVGVQLLYSASLSAIRFIQQAATATLNIAYYK